MKTIFLRTLWVCGALGVIAAPLVGCGGGAGSSSSSSTVKSTGKASFTLKWPVSSSRFVPGNTVAYGVVILDGGNVIDSKFANRPTDGSALTLTFDKLPIGNLTVVVSAYPSAITSATQPGVTAIASATKAFTTTKGGGTPTAITFTLASAVNRINVSSAQLTASGGIFTLDYQVLDAAGNTVLTPTNTIQVSSDNAAVVQVLDPTISAIKPLTVGAANITVTYDEKDANGQETKIAGSGKVTVLAAPAGGSAGGTGGGAGGTGGATQTGLAQISVSAPATGIQSIVVQADNIVPPAVQDWQNGQGSAQVFLDSLAAGAHAITVTAYSMTGGKGDVVGTGSGSATVTGGQLTKLNVSLTNGVSTLFLNTVDATKAFNDPSKVIGNPIQTGTPNVKLEVTGAAAANPTALLTNSAFAYAVNVNADSGNALLSTDPGARNSLVTVNPTTGLMQISNPTGKNITAVITATDLYSTKTAQTTVIVAPSLASSTINVK